MTALHQPAGLRLPRPDVVAAHQERMRTQVCVYRLRELREQLHMTPTELAARLDVSQNRVVTIERGDLAQAQVDTLRRHVEALGGTLDLKVRLGDESFRMA